MRLPRFCDGLCRGYDAFHIYTFDDADLFTFLHGHGRLVRLGHDVCMVMVLDFMLGSCELFICCRLDDDTRVVFFFLLFDDGRWLN